MKKLLKIIGVLALILLFLLLISPLWLGPVAGMIANSVVPGMTGTEFSVEKVRINPYTGSLRVEKLRLANPKGYGAEDAVALDLLSVKIEPMSVFKDTIKITDVTLQNPYISYLDKDGTNNFDQIIANVNASKTAKEEEKAKEEPEKAEGKKVVIAQLAIKDMRVRYGLVTIPIPNLTFKDIGVADGGVTIESIGLEIWEKIKASVLSVGGALGGVVGDAAKMLGDGASGLVNSVTSGDAVKGATDGAKKAAGAVTDGAKKAVDTVTDGTKKATEAIGNLFK